MIEVDHITKSFDGIRAVDDVSFSIKEGEKMVLLGTSGSGKTTLLKMINRLLEGDSGEIRIDGQSIGNQRPEQLRRKIGYVFQNIGLFPHYTVEENISIVPRLLGEEKDRIRQRVRELMEKLRLPFDRYGSSYPRQLSGGQQQRVGLARALAAHPPVLLMDEPFGALDPITRAHVRKDFKGLDELKNTTVILVTHDMLEAFELADRICLMDKGRIVQVGAPNDLLFHPANDFVRTFFDDQRFQLEVMRIRPDDHPALIEAFTQFKNRQG